MSEWIIFREVYFKVIASILVVVAAMLVLQSSLNQLKLRALVAEATSSRLQISAANIDAAIVRADALGFAMDEMVGLQDLIDRERERDGSIQRIQIVSPVGTTLLNSGVAQTSEDEREQVLRRVLGSGDRTTRIDVGDRLYTGRLLFDSSDGVMGAVILTTPSEAYLNKALAAFRRMSTAYLAVFGMVAVLLVPFIIWQFSGVRHAYRVLDPDAVGRGAPVAGVSDVTGLGAAIAEGDAEYAKAEAELQDLSAAPHFGEKTA